MIEDLTLSLKVCGGEQIVSICKDYEVDNGVMIYIKESDPECKIRETILYVSESEAKNLINAIEFMFKIGKYKDINILSK